MIFGSNILKSKVVNVALVLLCLVLFVANLRTTPPYVSNGETTQTENSQEEQDEPSAQVLRISDALQSAAQITLDFQSILLDEVEQDDEKQSGNVVGDQFNISQSKTLRILLVRIISPNAP